MKIHVLTLFPEMFPPVTDSSILGRAQEKGILNFDIINIRDFSRERHDKADDTPYGGGAGMVMLADPIFGALNSVNAEGKTILYMSPRGKRLDSELVCRLADLPEMVILCGHYEGVDQRVIDYWGMEEVSIGDYVVTGGELPAMVLIDAVSRLIPGVLGNDESAMEDSIYSGLLECDQYTRPREYEGMEVPDVLFNGNHQMIHLWQYENALRLTKNRRPDLFEAYLRQLPELTKGEKKILEKVTGE